MHATRWIRTGIALGLTVGALTLFAANVHPQTPVPKPLPANLARGQQVFLQYCAMCHGDGGQGDGDLAAQIRVRANVRVANLTDLAEIERVGRAGVRRTVAGGGAHTGRSNLMPAWDERLTKRELEDVVDYVMHLAEIGNGLSSTTMRAYLESPPGVPEAGHTLFVHQCSACHGMTAHGDGPLAASLIAKRHVHPRNLTDSSYIATKSDRDLFAVISNGSGPMGKSTYMPHWSGYLTAAQIKDLVSHVRAVSRTPSRP